MPLRVLMSGLGAALFAGTIWFTATGEDVSTDERVAFVHDAVRSHLVCPATASFPDGDSDKIGTSVLPDMCYEEWFKGLGRPALLCLMRTINRDQRIVGLNSYVDAENRFSANVRMKYSAILIEQPDSVTKRTVAFLAIDGVVVEKMKDLASVADASPTGCGGAENGFPNCPHCRNRNWFVPVGAETYDPRKPSLRRKGDSHQRSKTPGK